MTEQEKELQDLRRDIEKLKRTLEEYERMHQLDMAEITYLRRQIDFLIDGEVVSNRPQMD